jgi:hypothetical protein
VLSVVSNENIEETLLNIERQGSVANSRNDIFPFSFVLIKALLFMNLLVYDTFPDMTGKLDFNSGFWSNDPLFHKWCFDLFNFYWNKATRKVVV